jgi:hypothetical protein
MPAKQLIGCIYKSYLRNENQKNPSTKNQISNKYQLPKLKIQNMRMGGGI